MLLESTISPTVALGAYHRCRLAIIDQHDYSGVCRKVAQDLAKVGITRNQGWYSKGILALKQYYAVALLDGRNMHAVSDRVDPFWHAHILHTKDYVQFCDDVVGGYMHHDPLDHGMSKAVDHVAMLYDFTMKRYGELYTFVDSDFNPATLRRDELICVHFGNSYPAAAHSLFPADPAAQPLETRH